jgi:hypothetical protein
VLGEILVFLGILFVGLIYVWAKHDLEWIKKVPVESPQESQQDVAA